MDLGVLTAAVARNDYKWVYEKACSAEENMRSEQTGVRWARLRAFADGVVAALSSARQMVSAARWG
jgi:hypothetical protein